MHNCSTLLMRRASVAALLAAACSLAACGSTTSATASQCAPGSGTSRTVLTPHYRMVAYIGPVQQMYAKSQVAGHQLTKAQTASGEEMISGTMTPYPGSGGMDGMSGMGAPPVGSAHDYRHLEVHVCSRATGKVVTNLHPNLTVTDNTAHGTPAVIPISVMQGIDTGVRDLHYGNNALMPPGHDFTITMIAGADTGVFHLNRPLS